MGGMGPGASAYFYQLLVKLAQQKYGAQQDTDYPSMIIYSLPLAGFTELGVADDKAVKKQLIAGVRKLEKAGADFIVIPCNSVHQFYNDMQKTVAVPIISIIEATIKEVKKKDMRKVGVLSSETMKKLGLYHKALQENGNKVLLADNKQQEMVNKLILSVMTGDYALGEVKILDKIISDFASKGAEGVVIGCTELPLIAQNIVRRDIVLFDSTLILAETALARAYLK